MKERKKYSKEFKLDAVSLVLEKGYTRREAANSLDINTQMLGRWVKEHQTEDGQAFRGNGKLIPWQGENWKLKAQVKRLGMERDILIKPRHSLQQKRSEILVRHPTQECLPDQPG